MILAMMPAHHGGWQGIAQTSSLTAREQAEWGIIIRHIAVLLIHHMLVLSPKAVPRYLSMTNLLAVLVIQ